MRYRILMTLTGLNTLVLSAVAANPTILSVNNEANIQFIGGYQSQKIDAPEPPFLQSASGFQSFAGAAMEVTKTLGDHLYTDFQLGLMRHYLSYDGNTLLDDAVTHDINMQAKLGWSFYPSNSIALTPYATFSYVYSQLDTGGTFDPTYQSSFAGDSEFFQTGLYGGGLLMQWAATSRLVLSMDGSGGETLHPWTRANIPTNVNLGGNSVSAVIYQQANLGNQPWLSVALKADYQLVNNLHGLLGVQYDQLGFNGGKTTPDALLTIPGQRQYDVLYSAGLGYSFGQLTQDYSNTIAPDYRQALQLSNNMAELAAGTLHQNYGEQNSGSSAYLDRQTGTMPYGLLALTKTFGPLYTHTQISESIGSTAYIGTLQNGSPSDSTTRNTITTLSTQLGYQWFPSDRMDLTPYATIGYRHWLRDTAGVPNTTYGVLLNGSTETYVNDWYGGGLLAQLAVTDTWVMNTFAEYGRTFNANLTNWAAISGTTAQTQLDLYARPYFQTGIGSDYRFYGNWHLLANISYQSFGFGKSNADNLGILEPSSTTHEVISTLGLGYSF